MLIEASVFVIPMLAAHVVVDFLLQTDNAARKKSGWKVLLWHSFQIGMVTYVLTGIIGSWPVSLAFLVSHLIIDAIKSKSGEERIQVFLVDQAAHLLMLTAIALGAHRLGLWSVPPVWFRLFGMDYYRILLILSGAVIVSKAGMIFLRIALKGLEPRGDGGEGAEDRSVSIPGGGSLIGVLERSLIFLFVLAGEPQAIGFLIAAKSILRFGETSGASQKKAEYVIIGTLSSFLFGLVAAYAIKIFIGKL